MTMKKHLPRFMSSKAQAKADLVRRLEACLEIPGNRTCADCSEPKPTWASLLVTTSKKGKRKQKMGVFCCYKCCSYHFQLGRDVCEVKNIKSADDWTEDEVKAMERSGNDLVNEIYEANKSGKKRMECGAMKANQDEQVRSKFVQDKYQRKKYFCTQAGQIHDSDDSDNEADSDSESEIKSSSPVSNTSKATTPVEADSGHGSGNFMARLMEKSTAGIAPKTATGKAAQEKLSESLRADEDTPIISPEDLGYGEPDPAVDLGYGVDLGYEDTAKENDIMQKLANQALVRTGSRRNLTRQGSRLRVGVSQRGSIGSSNLQRQASNRGLQRQRSSRGSIGYGADREVTNRRQRSSLGFYKTDDEDEAPEEDLLLPSCSKSGVQRRSSLGSRRIETTTTNNNNNNGSKAESPTTADRPKRQSGKRGSLGRANSFDSKAEEKPKRRSGRRGSLGRQHSSESMEDEDKPRRGSDKRSGRTSATAEGVEEKPRRRSDRRGSLGRQQSSSSIDSEERPKRRSGRRGSVGRVQSFDDVKPHRHYDAAKRRNLARQGSEAALGLDRKQQPRPRDSEVNRRRRGSMGTNAKKDARRESPDQRPEPRPQRRTSVGKASCRSKSPERKEQSKRNRRRCSIGGPNEANHSIAAVAY